jgi:hypothetical protein
MNGASPTRLIAVIGDAHPVILSRQVGRKPTGACPFSRNQRACPIVGTSLCHEFQTASSDQSRRKCIIRE